MSAEAVPAAVLAVLGPAPGRIEPGKLHRFFTLQAEAALHGIALQRFAAGSVQRFIVSRWGIAREFESLAEAVQLIELMTGFRLGGGAE